MNKITGLHHITAISGNAVKNYDFYTRVMGLRFVKKTVNFDDPHTYHLYYGDETGSPGTILTFFPWEDISTGRRGTHMATEIGYSIPEGSIDFWLKRLEKENVIYNKPSSKFGEVYLTFIDPDGLKVELTVPEHPDPRTPWVTGSVQEEQATRGFHHVTLTLEDIQPTADLLVSVFGYTLEKHHTNRYRFASPAGETGGFIDLVEAKGEARGHVAGGTVHHIALRVPDEATQLHYRGILEERGLHITPQLDRKYFRSVYFREPGGVLFELATDAPGFTVDEPVATLGTKLMLPPQYESMRAELEQQLIKLD
ncbi:ring-cleaving dioxygenase [Chitinophaga nivalis]|uniref:Ring-cleaving dioxygenase n=1 Tax=Chitinophaga nivalis TaxID=2991709 RepID=A0ABT3ILD5_9BACT|nr:ring-cleaving dioxygenase [Chitinophaga nivalis]MCW3465534.1 ring-cleaving dioxygenase [Chitinophaga nivalis]MCW3484775.1 ring-cleaving dioxygenase [Chitinophaga nivalis]